MYLSTGKKYNSVSKSDTLLKINKRTWKILFFVTEKERYTDTRITCNDAIKTKGTVRDKS